MVSISWPKYNESNTMLMFSLEFKSNKNSAEFMPPIIFLAKTNYYYIVAIFDRNLWRCLIFTSMIWRVLYQVEKLILAGNVQRSRWEWILIDVLEACSGGMVTFHYIHHQSCFCHISSLHFYNSYLLST